MHYKGNAPFTSATANCCGRCIRKGLRSKLGTGTKHEEKLASVLRDSTV